MKKKPILYVVFFEMDGKKEWDTYVSKKATNKEVCEEYKEFMWEGYGRVIKNVTAFPQSKVGLYRVKLVKMPHRFYPMQANEETYPSTNELVE